MKLRHVCLVVMFVCSSLTASARTIYVDNVGGDDLRDGLSRVVTGRKSGPVRTLARAMQVARFGDTVSLANNDVPYYETLSLTGGRHSGNNTVPFRVLGNGATISGARTVPAHAWREHANRVWSFEPEQKGHYQLMLDGQQVTRFQPGDGQSISDTLPEGQWATHSGRIYFRVGKNQDPTTMLLTVAQGSVGVSMYGVRYVIIQDLKLEHFRLDGLNAHDLCKNILVQRVTSSANARAGITVAGSSRVAFSQCTVQGNPHSIRLDERGQANLNETNVDKEPTVSKP